jgi:hypothetical protein
MTEFKTIWERQEAENHITRKYAGQPGYWGFAVRVRNNTL